MGWVDVFLAARPICPSDIFQKSLLHMAQALSVELLSLYGVVDDVQGYHADDFGAFWSSCKEGEARMAA
jgi:hypothetical protein